MTLKKTLSNVYQVQFSAKAESTYAHTLFGT